jgi:hypothetical protein
MKQAHLGNGVACHLVALLTNILICLQQEGNSQGQKLLWIDVQGQRPGYYAHFARKPFLVTWLGM